MQTRSFEDCLRSSACMAEGVGSVEEVSEETRSALNAALDHNTQIPRNTLMDDLKLIPIAGESHISWDEDHIAENHRLIEEKAQAIQRAYDAVDPLGLVFPTPWWFDRVRTFPYAQIDERRRKRRARYNRGKSGVRPRMRDGR